MLKWSQMLEWSQKNPPQLLKEMTSSKAFRCVQAWLLEKPAAWADEDAPCLAAALMAQRPSTKRPREDALLEAERSHQRRRIELLEEQLLGEEAEVRRLEQCFAASTDLEEIMSFKRRPRAPSGQSLPCAGLRLMIRGAEGGTRGTRS